MNCRKFLNTKINHFCSTSADAISILLSSTIPFFFLAQFYLLLASSLDINENFCPYYSVWKSINHSTHKLPTRAGANQPSSYWLWSLEQLENFLNCKENCESNSKANLSSFSSKLERFGWKNYFIVELFLKLNC